jgi:CheY-like chemotaxis protein
VRVYLPQFVDADGQEDASLAGGHRIGTVLITEDDPDLLAVAVEGLRALGDEVYSAANAAEAMTILKRDAPIDVLFTDIVMPRGMNGVELARAARRLRPGLRVLLSSGYARPGLQPDPDAFFLPKPYQITELAHQLETLIASNEETRGGANRGASWSELRPGCSTDGRSAGPHLRPGGRQKSCQAQRPLLLACALGDQILT